MSFLRTKFEGRITLSWTQLRASYTGQNQCYGRSANDPPYSSNGPAPLKLGFCPPSATYRNPRSQVSSASTTMDPPRYKRLSAADAQVKREKSLYFRCNGKYYLGHKCKLKELLVLLANDEPNLKEPILLEETKEQEDFV